MQFPEVLLPKDITLETLQALYDRSGLETKIDADGDLVITRGVSAYVMLSEQANRVLLLTFVGIKEEISRNQKLEFANRVNNEIAAVRAHVNSREGVVFDYHVPIEGGVTSEAFLAATDFFLIAIAHAIDRCDQDDIVR
ncbi:YbjN domain-containing protein [Roseiconus nitratireducens]|nr:YbjN domain-containing protein [Roseiconus nitratireducens]